MAGLALKNPVTVQVTEPRVSPKVSVEEGHASIVADPVAAFSMPAGLRHFLLVVPCKLRLVALVAFLLLKSRVNSILIFRIIDNSIFHN